MSDTPNGETGTTTASCRLRYDVVERRLAEMGVTSDVGAAAQLNVTRQTIYRWRNGLTGVSLSTALNVSQVLDVRLEQLIESGAA